MHRIEVAIGMTCQSKCWEVCLECDKIRSWLAEGCAAPQRRQPASQPDNRPASSAACHVSSLSHFPLFDNSDKSDLPTNLKKERTHHPAQPLTHKLHEAIKNLADRISTCSSRINSSSPLRLAMTRTKKRTISNNAGELILIFISVLLNSLQASTQRTSSPSSSGSGSPHGFSSPNDAERIAPVFRKTSLFSRNATPRDPQAI